MRALLCLFLLTLLTFAGACTYVFFSGPEVIGRHSAHAFLVAIPDASLRADLARSSGIRALELDAAYGSWLGRRREEFLFFWQASVLHATAAWNGLTLALTLLFTAASFGLLRRERSRTDFAYASTTFGALAKLLFGYSIVGYLLIAFIPVGLPIGFLYVFMLTGALGTFGFLSNVPPKI